MIHEKLNWLTGGGVLCLLTFHGVPYAFIGTVVTGLIQLTNTYLIHKYKKNGK